jgi:hypothetical protein
LGRALESCRNWGREKNIVDPEKKDGEEEKEEEESREEVRVAAGD